MRLSWPPGVKKLQCTSFVSPKAIPQMQDATQIAQTLLEKHPEVDLFALVPNFRGAQSAVEAGLKTVSPVISLSVSHNQNNVRRTHEQSFDELKRIMDTFPELNIDLDVATAFGCPFEGRMTVPALVDFVGKLYDLGIRSFNICDTIGVAYPTQIRETFQALMAAYPDVHFSVHIHDTRNMGILNSLEAVRCGVDTVQTTLAAWAAAPLPPAPPATPPRKTLSICWTGRAMRPASTRRSCWPPLSWRWRRFPAITAATTSTSTWNRRDFKCEIRE